ncbi:MAG TPA: DUF202 domain-containing protein [Gemmatimonadaceae bacterium]|nr:DUF202 domain-containing protein [Gemmatimonadaceae bacterium]
MGAVDAVDAVAAMHAPAPSLELSERQTGLAFQRTRMSADRTLMSIIRTSLALISFGFTIYQFFNHLKESGAIATTRPAARNFGGALVLIGVGMLAAGIVYHLSFMRGLRQERNTLKAAGLIYAESRFPVSLTVIVALLVLLVGVLAMASIVFHSGPFE